MRELHNMDVLLAFLTDDFHESEWTNQEIGFALGRQIPVVPFKLQESNPRGFISSIRATKGNLKNIEPYVSNLGNL